MKILVTGGRGQLGLSFKKIAGNHPHAEFVFTDMPEGNITCPDVVEGLLEEYNPDVVINCAAYTAVDKAESDEEAAGRINADGPRVLARAVKARGIKLVHISTDYVFRGDGDRPLRETDTPDPAGVYGRTKLEGERFVENEGCDAVVVRTSWLYSEFGNNFVKTMLRLAACRSEIGVVSDQTGAPTYAPDLAEAVMALVKRGISGFDIYHYGNSGITTWYDFAKDIFSLAGIDVEVNPLTTEQYPTPARRPSYSVLDTAKIRAVGAIAPQWRESLAGCIEILKND